MSLPPAKRSEHSRKDLAILLLLAAVGGLLTQLPSARKLSVTHHVRSTALLPVLEVHRYFAERARLVERFDSVRVERDALARELARQRSLSAHSQQLRSLLGLDLAGRESFSIAEIEPGHSRFGDSRTFYLSTRFGAGVYPPVGVFTTDGLVGVVRTSTGRVSEGDFWTHPEFRVSVRTEDGRATGIVRALYDESQPVMLLEGAPYQTEIPAGTLLHTSGVGGIYPPGIPVGAVRETSAVESGWERSYRVEPAVRPEQVDVALVWDRGRRWDRFPETSLP